MTAPGTEQRRLAAIMFTDMVGYSALAQRNEALSLELLEEHRSLLRSHFPRHNGTEIKTIGDAFLVEFSSALEAARCAIEIQRTLAHRNTDAPADRRIQIRIGIHIGDVVHREGDVYGDGVNIASRIEPLAGPSGICISMDVERQIRHALEASLVRLPPAALKNIQVPMELFRIELPWEKEAQAQRSATRVSKKLPAVAATAAVVVVGLILGAWLIRRSSRDRPLALLQTNTVVAASSNAPALAPGQQSVAVLPFVNTSSDKENEYLSDGMTDELINTLQPLHGLQVKGRASSFYFKGKNERLQKIGQDLHVKYLVEGTVSKVGNKLRITVDLVTAADELQLWAMKDDRPLDDLLAIRTDVATRVAEALKGHLLGDERQQLAKQGTDNAEAHRLYLQGRQLWNRRTGESINQAIDYFNQAIAKDPGYALAYAGLADCYDVLPTYTTLPPRETFSKARAAALKALELDSTLVEPRAVLADLKAWLDWDWSGAEKEFRQAIALNPNLATTHHWLAEILVCLGRYPEALVQGTRAQEIDPLSPIINARLGHTLALAGKADLGIALLQRQIALDPSFGAAHKFLGGVYFDQANWAGAISELELARKLDVGGIYGSGLLGAAYLRCGRTNEAQKILGQMLELQRQAQSDCHLGIAAVQHALGEDDAALDWLEKALTQHSFGLEDLNSSSFWKDLRTHPRTQAILKKMNLEK